MQLSIIRKKKQILPSVDTQYTFWLKSFYQCNEAEKSNNLAARSLQNQFVTNLHEVYALMRYKIEYINLVRV